MKYLLSYSLAVIGLVIPAQCLAGIVISVDNVSIVQGTASIDVQVLISHDDPPDDNVNSATFAFGVGDGGPVLGGSDIVPVTGFSLDQSIFDTNPTVGVVDTSPFTVNPTAPPPANSAILMDINPPGGDSTSVVVPTGIFGTVTLDTSSLVAGQSFALDPNIAGFSAFGGAGAAVISFTSTPGLLTVTSGAAVPEPSTFAILGLGFVGVIVKRRRRQQDGNSQAV